MAFIRPATNYIPDINFGRPLSNAQVYLMVSTAAAPQKAADVNPADLLTVTYINDAGNTITAVQPLRTTKGGCLFEGCKQEIKQFQIAENIYKVAVYDLQGNLEYQGVMNSTDGLAVVSETAPTEGLLQGLRWYKPSDAVTYIWYVDEDGAQWVEEPVQSAEGTLRSELAGAASTVLVGGVEAGDLSRKYNEFVSVKDFGAVGDGVADDTSALLAAIASLSVFGGIVYIPSGIYKITQTIYVPSGVTLQGDGSFNGLDPVRRGATTLFCSHTGAAMVSFKGSNGCSIRDIALFGDQLAKPKTGLCMGRSSADSAGHHQVDNISIQGWYTVAAIYSIASEENEVRKVFAWNFGGDAPYGIVTSTHDVFSVDGLIASTNIHSLYSNVILYVTSPLVSAAAILLETSNDMGNIRFEQCYIVLQAGSYVRVSSGQLDGDAGFGPIVFDGVSGEPLAGGSPEIGLSVTATVPVLLAGLTVQNARFQLPANTGGNIYDILVEDNVTLLNPNIVIQPPEAFPYAFSQVPYNKVKGGIVSVGREYEWTNLSLQGTWADNFGAPYAAASYKVDPTGRVLLRGDIFNGTGLIASLPTDLWPASNTTYTSGSDRILVNTSGQIIHLSGPATNVTLSSVSFDLN